MKVLIHLAHPAHFHLFKNVIMPLQNKGHIVRFSYNEKDVLALLVNDFNQKDKFSEIVATKRLNNKFDLYKQFIEKGVNFLIFAKSFNPDIILGTSIIVSLIGKYLRKTNIIVNEDDFDIIGQTANLGYRFASSIICPKVCRTGKWDDKCIKYNGYHELAYLSPKYFSPDKRILKKYGISDQNYCIIRFAKLLAHHDKNAKGISNELAVLLINEIRSRTKVYITSERDLPNELMPYILRINPLDIHHVMAFSRLYIGDSQTMAAESGVLGVPFIRYNKFVGKISYLNELENSYKLGFGILPDNPDSLLKRSLEVLDNPFSRLEWLGRRDKMLAEKEDVVEFIVKNIVKWEQE